MPQLFRRYATPFITTLFLISLVTGIALFFHVGPSSFHGMHEILSIALVVPFALHIWRNWRAFAGYFRHAPMAIALVLSLALAGAFMLPSDSSGRPDGPPQFQLAHMVAGATVADAAPALGLTPADLTARLAAGGIPLDDPSVPMSKAAEAAGKTETALAAVLVGR